MRLAVLGDPLSYTRSPELHRAGLAALGLHGESEPLRVTPARLGSVFAELIAAGFRGVNLTSPLKEAALGHVGAIAPSARRARSVNTVSFDADAVRGDTTDGAGFIDLLRAQGRACDGLRVVLLGAGGAARSIGLALIEAGASVTVAARRPAAAAAAWHEIAGAAVIPWGTESVHAAVAVADVVVNGTPLAGLSGAYPVERIPPAALVLDLVYGPEPTPWVLAARAAGRQSFDGLGLLVHQARRALAIWTGREVPLEPLARAVGWPR